MLFSACEIAGLLQQASGSVARLRIIRRQLDCLLVSCERSLCVRVLLHLRQQEPRSGQRLLTARGGLQLDGDPQCGRGRRVLSVLYQRQSQIYIRLEPFGTKL